MTLRDTEYPKIIQIPLILLQDLIHALKIIPAENSEPGEEGGGSQGDKGEGDVGDTGEKKDEGKNEDLSSTMGKVFLGTLARKSYFNYYYCKTSSILTVSLSQINGRIKWHKNKIY